MQEGDTSKELLVKGDLRPELAMLCNQASPQVEELGYQLSHKKTFDLQFVISAGCAETRIQHNHDQGDQRDFTHLMTADSESHSKYLPELGEL